MCCSVWRAREINAATRRNTLQHTEHINLQDKLSQIPVTCAVRASCAHLPPKHMHMCDMTYKLNRELTFANAPQISRSRALLRIPLKSLSLARIPLKSLCLPLFYMVN